MRGVSKNLVGLVTMLSGIEIKLYQFKNDRNRMHIGFSRPVNISFDRKSKRVVFASEAKQND